MLLLRLAGKSLRNRLLTTVLTVASIALSVALLVGVENVRTGMRDSFANTISQTDLIVGPRGGSIQLLLYAVFGMGSPTTNIDFHTYEEWRDHPAIAWTIPYSLGDSHRGFRVIGTDENFYRHYRYRRDRGIELAEGRPATEMFDVVIGSEVAARLGYRLGQHIVVTHGLMGTGIMDHDERPFTIVGILERTGTPVDRAVYITLDGIAAAHADWHDGAPPIPGEETPSEHLLEHGVHVDQITAFFVGARSRIDALRIQREINTWEEEPLSAIVPGVALGEMWRGIGYAEEGLRIVTFFVIVVGLLGMLVALYTSLNARRREMAILRAVGVGPKRIISLLVLESGVLAALGTALGVALVYVLLFTLQTPVEQRFGLFLPIRAPGGVELLYVAAVIIAGFLIGLIPAIKAYRNTLADGLSIRV